MPIANGKNAVSRDQDRRHKKILAECLREPGNKICADCQARGPTWASVNLGVFVCLTCSGIHRSLGVHVSQVRSTTLDTWLPKQVAFIKNMGNVKANAYWEHSMAPSFVRPRDNMQLNYFIRSKYLDKQYAPRNQEPPTILNFDENQIKTRTIVDESKAQNIEEKISKTPVKVEVIENAIIEKEAIKQEKTLNYPEIDLLGLDEAEITANEEIPVIHEAVTTEWARFEDNNTAPAIIGSPSLSWTAFEGPTASTTITNHMSEKAESPNPFDFPSDIQNTSISSSSQNPITMINQNATNQVTTTNTTNATKQINTTEDILKLYDKPSQITTTNTFMQTQPFYTNMSNHSYFTNMSNHSYYNDMSNQQYYHHHHHHHQNMYSGIVGNNNMVPVAAANGAHLNYNGNPWNINSATGSFGSHGQSKS